MGDAEEPSRWARLKPWYLLAIPTTLLLGWTALRSKKRMNLYLKEAKKVSCSVLECAEPRHKPKTKNQKSKIKNQKIKNQCR